LSSDRFLFAVRKKPHGGLIGRGKHAVCDLKYVLVWIPKYRSGALETNVAERARPVSQMVSGKCGIIIDTT